MKSDFDLHEFKNELGSIVTCGFLSCLASPYEYFVNKNTGFRNSYIDENLFRIAKSNRSLAKSLADKIIIETKRIIPRVDNNVNRRTKELLRKSQHGSFGDYLLKYQAMTEIYGDLHERIIHSSAMHLVIDGFLSTKEHYARLNLNEEELIENKDLEKGTIYLRQKISERDFYKAISFLEKYIKIESNRDNPSLRILDKNYLDMAKELYEYWDDFLVKASSIVFDDHSNSSLKKAGINLKKYEGTAPGKILSVRYNDGSQDLYIKKLLYKEILGKKIDRVFPMGNSIAVVFEEGDSIESGNGNWLEIAAGKRFLNLESKLIFDLDSDIGKIKDSREYWTIANRPIVEARRYVSDYTDAMPDILDIVTENGRGVRIAMLQSTQNIGMISVSAGSYSNLLSVKGNAVEEIMAA